MSETKTYIPETVIIDMQNKVYERINKLNETYKEFDDLRAQADIKGKSIQSQMSEFMEIMRFLDEHNSDAHPEGWFDEVRGSIKFDVMEFENNIPF